MLSFMLPKRWVRAIRTDLYFGTNRLYRSVDRANTSSIVSQVFQPGQTVTAIAISPQDDNVRLVGLSNGKVFATLNGGVTMLQVAGAGATNGTGTTPAAPVGRIAIDPNNRDVAYIAFNGFGTPSAPMAHVWKTENLGGLTDICGQVEFTAVSTGLPDIPVNAIAIDPVTLVGSASSDVYVGTDAGVFLLTRRRADMGIVREWVSPCCCVRSRNPEHLTHGAGGHPWARALRNRDGLSNCAHPDAASLGYAFGDSPCLRHHLDSVALCPIGRVNRHLHLESGQRCCLLVYRR